MVKYKLLYSQKYRPPMVGTPDFYQECVRMLQEPSTLYPILHSVDELARLGQKNLSICIKQWENVILRQLYRRRSRYLDCSKNHVAKYLMVDLDLHIALAQQAIKALREIRQRAEPDPPILPIWRLHSRNYFTTKPTGAVFFGTLTLPTLDDDKQTFLLPIRGRAVRVETGLDILRFDHDILRDNRCPDVFCRIDSPIIMKPSEYRYFCKYPERFHKWVTHSTCYGLCRDYEQFLPAFRQNLFICPSVACLD